MMLLTLTICPFQGSRHKGGGKPSSNTTFNGLYLSFTLTRYIISSKAYLALGGLPGREIERDFPLNHSNNGVCTNVTSWASEPVRIFVGGYKPVQL